MAELTITVRRTDDGLVVRVGLESDEDALPHEHEALHRRLVAELFPGAEVVRERPAAEAAVG
jgi:hypothetical protein